MKLISKRMKAIFNQNIKSRFLCRTFAPKQCDTPEQKWVLKDTKLFNIRVILFLECELIVCI
jgi:hypothetical protein